MSKQAKTSPVAEVVAETVPALPAVATESNDSIKRVWASPLVRSVTFLGQTQTFDLTPATLITGEFRDAIISAGIAALFDGAGNKKMSSVELWEAFADRAKALNSGELAKRGRKAGESTSAMDDLANAIARVKGISVEKAVAALAAMQAKVSPEEFKERISAMRRTPDISTAIKYIEAERAAARAAKSVPTNAVDPLAEFL